MLAPAVSAGFHIGITYAAGLTVTVATGSGEGEGARPDWAGKPLSQVAARTLEAGRRGWLFPAVAALGGRRTTSTTRLPVAPPLRGMLRSSRCSVVTDWLPPRRAKTWSISDMDLQEAFGCLIGFSAQRSAGDLLVWRSCERLAVLFLNSDCDLLIRKQSDQVDKAWGENRPTLKVRRLSAVSERKPSLVPYAHHQGRGRQAQETCATGR